MEVEPLIVGFFLATATSASGEREVKVSQITFGSALGFVVHAQSRPRARVSVMVTERPSVQGLQGAPAAEQALDNVGGSSRRTLRKQSRRTLAPSRGELTAQAAAVAVELQGRRHDTGVLVRAAGRSTEPGPCCAMTAGGEQASVMKAEWCVPATTAAQEEEFGLPGRRVDGGGQALAGGDGGGRLVQSRSRWPERLQARHRIGSRQSLAWW